VRRAIVVSALAFAVSLAVAPLAAPPAFAGTQINANGRFSIWVPDDWEVTFNGKRLSAESEELTLVAQPLTDKTAALTDDDVKDFVGNELDNIRIAVDRLDKLDGFDIRLLEGFDDDDNAFSSLALLPRAGERVIQVLVYGGTAEMGQPEVRSTVDRILRSLRPAAPNPPPLGAPVR
jgi:hypothetical protein